MTDIDRALQYVLKNLMLDDKQGLIGRCDRCNSLVLLSETSGYPAQCITHDEDLCGFEYHFEDLETVTLEDFSELYRNVLDKKIFLKNS